MAKLERFGGRDGSAIDKLFIKRRESTKAEVEKSLAETFTQMVTQYEMHNERNIPGAIERIIERISVQDDQDVTTFPFQFGQAYISPSSQEAAIDVRAVSAGYGTALILPTFDKTGKAPWCDIIAVGLQANCGTPDNRNLIPATVDNDLRVQQILRESPAFARIFTYQLWNSQGSARSEEFIKKADRGIVAMMQLPFDGINVPKMPRIRGEARVPVKDPSEFDFGLVEDIFAPRLIQNGRTPFIHIRQLLSDK